MNDFDAIAVYDPMVAMQIKQAEQKTAVATTDQSRAIAETQAMMIVAKRFPRDENEAYMRAMKACESPGLASVAMYAYKRGGTMVEGPTVRLMETLMRCWTNAVAGFQELSRDRGKSEVEAFAWDMEANVKFSRKFTVAHIRDKKGGNEAVTAERDVYELVANMAQRRVRSCIQNMVPGYIIDAAVNQCKKTLMGGSGKPLQERVRDMLMAFDQIGVTKAMVEAWLTHDVSAMVPAQLVRLQQIYVSIRDGVAPREEYFDMTAGKPEPANEPPPVEEPETTKRGPGRPPKMREPGEDE